MPTAMETAELGNTLSPAHLDLLHRCLKTKEYTAALTVLDNDIYHLPPTGFKYQDHLLYHLYGAMIYIGLWNWERATTYLEVVITAPVLGANVSMIQVEAYKKWVLVNLLVHGKQQMPPRNVPGPLMKHFKAVARAYDVLSESFEEPTSERLRAEIDIGPFAQDSNYTLALLVLAAHRRFKVQRLSKIYASVPITHVAALAFPDRTPISEVEGYVQNLIDNSQLPGASLVKSTNTYLCFTAQGSSTVPEAQLYNDLVQQRKKVDEISIHLDDTQRKVETSKHYIETVKKARKAEAKAAKAGQESGDTMPGAFDDDMVADM